MEEEQILNNLKEIERMNHNQLPVKYEPIKNYNFICQIDGVEDYVIYSVKLPKIYKSFFDKNDTLSCKGPIVITMCADMYGLIHQQLHETLKEKPNITIKYLDPCGDVVISRVFYRTKLLKIEESILSYADKSDLHKITTTFKCKKTKLITR